MINKVVAGRYRILRKIGQGGMGSVYLGELVGIGQRVALKFLNGNFSLDPEITRRFLNEARSYARVSHPNAVVLHDFGQDQEGGLFIAMEYVEGGDLKKILKERRRLPVAEANEIVLQVADVLARAHDKGIIHRDLKPENIMVRKGTRGLYVKVLDFGIARLVEEGTSRVTAQGAIAGTPRYMAPEQAEGKEIDARVDVYSLGLLFFELLTGVQPFDGASVPEIVRKQILLPMPHLQDVAPDLELPGIDAVIQKATVKNRDERYRTMEEFSADLGKAQPVHAAHAPLKTELGSEGTFIPNVPTPVHVSLATDFAQAHSKSARARLVPWIGGTMALALVAGGAYVRTMQPGQVAPAPAPPAAQSNAAPSTELPAAAVPTGPAGGAQSPAASNAAEVDAQVERVLWRHWSTNAQIEFQAGNLTRAKSILAEIPKDQTVEQAVLQLKSSIEQIDRKLARAKANSMRGDCQAAMRLYDEVLRVNPNIKEARDGRNECRRMLPPSLAE